MTLREGKNREIRKICDELGWAVNRLIRVSYGPFQLGNLDAGAVEEVPTRVLADQTGKGVRPPRLRAKEPRDARHRR
jgi:23S rRNA pseudouridine2605 synthase